MSPHREYTAPIGCRCWVPRCGAAAVLYVYVRGVGDALWFCDAHRPELQRRVAAEFVEEGR